MLKIPKKVLDRLNTTLKTFQNVAAIQKQRDVSEADTVTLVKDILADALGFDKYMELTSEQQIRGTYCDLAVKIEGKIRFLIEVKAAGIALNDSHLRQAINYGANQGIEWVVLTNGLDWRLYRIKFHQPIDVEEVSAFNILNINLKNEDDQHKIFLLCREGLTTDAMDSFHQHAQLLNKFTIAQVLCGEQVVGVIRRELRKLFPELRVENEAILDILTTDVLKREVVEGDKVKETQAKIKKAVAKLAKQSAAKTAFASELNPVKDIKDMLPTTTDSNTSTS
ncbi:MAG: type I restriction enzyme HsdR N-terminal domain-containing protein [Ignavibacteria bacterium]|nr:type I restriction enzyme HsdR N-terminal domain-containing protein [Ignavibacteria bacterium]